MNIKKRFGKIIEIYRKMNTNLTVLYEPNPDNYQETFVYDTTEDSAGRVHKKSLTSRHSDANVNDLIMHEIFQPIAESNNDTIEVIMIAEMWNHNYEIAWGYETGIGYDSTLRFEVESDGSIIKVE